MDMTITAARFSSTTTVDHAGQEEDEETHTPSEGEGDSVHNMVIKSGISKGKVRLTEIVNKGVITPVFRKMTM